MNDITIWLSENWIALTALVISLICAYISMEGYLKSIVKLKIDISDEDCFSFGYILYEERRVLMISAKISNISTSDTSIIGAEIKYLNKTYKAENFPSFLCNDRDGSGIMFRLKDNNSKAQLFCLNKNNLLNTRIDYHGVIEGYFTFLEFPLLHEKTILRITILTPTNSFTSTLIAAPLHDGYTIKNQIIPK